MVSPGQHLNLGPIFFFEHCLHIKSYLPSCIGVLRCSYKKRGKEQRPKFRDSTLYSADKGAAKNNNGTIAPERRSMSCSLSSSINLSRRWNRGTPIRCSHALCVGSLLYIRIHGLGQPLRVFWITAIESGLLLLLLVFVRVCVYMYVSLWANSIGAADTA